MKRDESMIFPVMGKWLTEENSMQMDFSNNNSDLLKLDLKSTENFNEYVFGFLKEKEKKYGFGGYLENRMIYQRSTHFQQGEARCMHLGMDVWADALHPIYSPMDAKVHSFANNNNFGDYGPTIILEHHLKGEYFYSLYGHLSLNSLKNIREGDTIKKGEKFCELGPYPENGDWPPHLHFQLISDLLGKSGDFPGVCAPSELADFKLLCADPAPFIVENS